MSAYTARCPLCGTVYFHCFVGTTLLSGHECPVDPDGARLIDAMRQTVMGDLMPLVLPDTFGPED